MESQHHSSVTHLVSYAPAIFLAALLVGMVVQINFPFSFVPELVGLAVGAILLFSAPILIIQAQKFRKTLYVPVTDRSCYNFNVGPYKISRHPTYLGLFMLLIGFAFLVNSLWLLVVGAIIFLLFTLWIVPKEEKLLTHECGGVYKEYQKKVRMWL